MGTGSVCKLDSNQNRRLKHKLMKRLFKTKRPLCFSSPQCKFLDLRIHVAEQCKEEHIREASICILLWTQRLWRSSQLGPTRIVLHLHNLRESSLLFSPKIFPNLFEASLYLSSLSGRLVCSAHTQLCIPALKATSLQMPVLAGDYLSNALWLVHAPRQNHSGEMKLDRLL